MSRTFAVQTVVEPPLRWRYVRFRGRDIPILIGAVWCRWGDEPYTYMFSAPREGATTDEVYEWMNLATRRENVT